MPVPKDSDVSLSPAPRPDGLLPEPHSEYYWLWVMCLLGVDYFSTLAYQPSITFGVAGRLGPLATVVVVLVTLFGALPVYFYVAGKSLEGQGSVALLERLVHGWAGKTLAGFLVSVPLVLNFDRAKDFQFVEKAQWIPSLGATYRIGIDGLGLLLVMLTTLITPPLLKWTLLRSAPKQPPAE